MATTYQGPHVSVTQQFVTSPGATAVESLPSAVVATAYDVYSKEKIGSSYGIIDTTIPWTDTDPIYNEDVAGKRAYDFYPPIAFIRPEKASDINMDLATSAYTSDGILVDNDAMYTVPKTEKLAGACQATIPYYKTEAGVAGTVKISAGALKTVNITGGTVLKAGIVPGQQVWILDTTWKLVGVVGSVGSSETSFNLADPHTVAITTGTAILIGAANASDLIDYGDTLYDPTANFTLAGVQAGDVLYFSSSSFNGSITTPLKATITAPPTTNTLKFNSDVLGAGAMLTNFLKYFPRADLPIAGSTIKIYSYSIKRLAGYSQSYNLKSKNGASGIVTVAGVSGAATNSIKIATTYAPLMKDGDLFSIMAAGPVPAGTEETANANLYLNRISTIVITGGNYVITTVDPILESDAGNNVMDPTAVYYVDAWWPRVESDIVVDYRAINKNESGVVKRISSIDDIRNAWNGGLESIDPRNELAFMASIIFNTNGGRVLYGINVDSSSASLSSEYADACEELKMIDVYSHCFGTTDSGVNAGVGPYCDEQAAPYEAHERIGIVTYDTDSIYRMGSGSGDISAGGAITSIVDFNAITSGITVGDSVEIYDDGAFVSTAAVTSTPTASDEVATDYLGTAITSTTATFVFKLGRKDAQAVAIGSLKYGNRRVSAIFPGWFTGVNSATGDQMAFPPYYISAAICGMDCSVLASQSFTNKPFSVPGIESINLGTTSYFRKAQLDEIGGGGINIMIQDVTPSISIKSRHDLTTDMSAVQYRERSITKQADVAAKTLRAAVAPYVGRFNVNDPNLFKFLAQVCSIVCTNLVKGGVVAKISVDNISRDEVIDDKINFSVSMTAFIAGNYYDITMLIKTR